VTRGTPLVHQGPPQGRVPPRGGRGTGPRALRRASLGCRGASPANGGRPAPAAAGPGQLGKFPRCPPRSVRRRPLRSGTPPLAPPSDTPGDCGPRCRAPAAARRHQQVGHSTPLGGPSQGQGQEEGQEQGAGLAAVGGGALRHGRSQSIGTTAGERGTAAASPGGKRAPLWLLFFFLFFFFPVSQQSRRLPLVLSL